MSSITKNGEISPMNSTINTTVSNVNESTRNASAINSTPIVYNNNTESLKGDSNRSSTSSW
jgi:hypothetical protein